MRYLLISALLAFAIYTSEVKSQTHNPFFEGYWYGLLEFQGTELILTFELKVENDSLAGTMNSPLQDANGIPITRIDANMDTLHIFMRSLSAHFKGGLNIQDSTLSGTFTQAIFKIPLTFKKTDELFTLRRPQEPQPPFEYITTDVMFENAGAGIQLAGTLTYPDNTGTFPAVVMITGSGPQDRNEEILRHKPFWVIADYLTKAGIAVLRFDDRGVAKSGGDFTTATSMDFATDVEAAVHFLKQHPRINASQIGLIGHSEGGMIAPIVAARDENIAFIVMMAGPGISGELILLTQTEKILQMSNLEQAMIKTLLKDSRKIYKILKKEPDTRKAATAIRKFFSKRAAKMTFEEQIQYGYSQQAVEAKIIAMNSPWFRFFLTFNPEDYLKRVSCPTFAMFGEKDIQVLPLENIRALERIAGKYRKTNFAIKNYSGKNHLFQNAQTGSIAEYGLIEETICPDVLHDMAVWINSVLNN